MIPLLPMAALLAATPVAVVDAADRPAAAPISLAHVLASVEAHHPVLQAATARQQAAQGRQQAARGVWDPELVGKATYIAAGAYPYRLADAQVRQATGLWGARLTGGYRKLVGPLPAYKGGLMTGQDGEVYAAVELPLLQGGAIDRRRAELRLSDRDLEAAAWDRQSVLLSLRRDAAHAFWGWVAAVRQQRVEAGLLALAEVRDQSLAEMVAQGEVPAIERLENQRAILQRRERLYIAERRVRAAAIKLSLFWRDGGGQPLAPDPARAPKHFPAPTEPAALLHPAGDLEVAYRQRPDLSRLAALRQAADIEVRLGANALLPKLDLAVGGHRELGGGYKAPASLDLGAQFSMPLALRQARGLWRSKQAERARVALELAYLRDRVATEVQDVHSLLANTYARQQVVDREVVVAREVEEAERERFALGESSLLIVNLREQATADAAKRLIENLADYWMAWGTYQSVLALAGAPRP